MIKKGFKVVISIKFLTPSYKFLVQNPCIALCSKFTSKLAIATSTYKMWFSKEETCKNFQYDRLRQVVLHCP